VASPRPAGGVALPRRAMLAAGPAIALASARTPVAAAPAGPPPLSAAAPAGPPPLSAPDWDYSALHGPSHWSDRFPTCGDGHFQAPINLDPPFTPFAPPKGELVRPAYSACPLVARDSGTTARWEVGAVDGTTVRALSSKEAAAIAPAGGVRVGDTVWPLAQLHFHAPGEEAVGGARAPLGLHLVHARPAAGLGTDASAAACVLGGSLEPPSNIVVTILFDAPPGGPDNPAVATLFSCLPAIREQKRGVVLPSFNAADLLPPSGRIDLPYGGAWAYSGGLTTPPCSEGVLFVVARARQAVSPAQAAALGGVGGFPPNARPLQPRHDRPVIII